MWVWPGSSRGQDAQKHPFSTDIYQAKNYLLYSSPAQSNKETLNYSKFGCKKFQSLTYLSLRVFCTIRQLIDYSLPIKVVYIPLRHSRLNIIWKLQSKISYIIY